MTFWKRPKVDTEEIKKNAEAASRQIEDQQSDVNRLTAWLIDRKRANGFGDDFEYTLKPKGRHT